MNCLRDVLRELGVDLGTPKPVEEALAMYDRLVSEMEAPAGSAALH